jgi:hypothetical protein
MNQRHKIVCILSGLLAGACASLPTRPSVTGRVTEYGIYDVFGRERVISGAPTPDGTVTLFSQYRFAQHTDRVPARIGVRFGFTYVLEGITEQTVDLQKVVKHPTFRNARGKIERMYSVTYRDTRADAISSIWGYELSRSEELVPGVWVIELWYNGRKVLSRSFTVYVKDQIGTRADARKP